MKTWIFAVFLLFSSVCHAEMINGFEEDNVPVLNELLRQIEKKGTGKSAWTQYAIPYASGTEIPLNEIEIGSAGQVLMVNSDGDGYEWDTAAGSGDISDVGDSSSGGAFTEDGTGNKVYFEGTTADDNEILVTCVDPTSDYTTTIPDASGYFVIDATECTDIEGTGLSITTGTLNCTLDLDGVCSAGYTTTSPIVVDDITVSNPSNVYSLSHDSFADFVANEHIDHSSVSVVAGTSLTGGGTIDSNVTLNVDETTISHDNLSGFVSNEHIDWTSASDNFSTTGTLASGQITMTDGSYYTSLTSGQIQWSSSNMYMRRATGISGVIIKGASDAKLMVYHGTGINAYYQIYANSNNIDFTFGSGIVDAVYNEDGNAIDYRWETDNNVYALYFNSNASTGVDRVHVLDNTGTSDFNVGGDVWIQESLTMHELTADPADPAEGNFVLWMSDGTGTGDDGDILIKVTASGTTKTTTLVDYSAI